MIRVEKEVTGFNLTKEYVDKLREYSRKYNLVRSQVIDHLLGELLEKWDNGDLSLLGK